MIPLFLVSYQAERISTLLGNPEKRTMIFPIIGLRKDLLVQCKYSTLSTLDESEWSASHSGMFQT